MPSELGGQPAVLGLQRGARVRSPAGQRDPHAAEGAASWSGLQQGTRAARGLWMSAPRFTDGETEAPGCSGLGLLLSDRPHAGLSPGLDRGLIRSRLSARTTFTGRGTCAHVCVAVHVAVHDAGRPGSLASLPHLLSHPR